MARRAVSIAPAFALLVGAPLLLLLLSCILPAAAGAARAAAATATAATTTTAATVLTQRSAVDTFEAFVESFGRTYGDASEEAARRAVWESNRASVAAHNSATLPYTLALNEFADWTEAELRSLRGVSKRLLASAAAPASLSAPLPPSGALPPLLPRRLDWRERGVVGPVKNQGGCGSCWTFAAAAAIESAHALATGAAVVLAEQNLLDCAPNPLECGGAGGCTGGTPELAFSFAQLLGGVAAEASYPYAPHPAEADSGANASVCRYDPVTTPPAARVVGYEKLPSNDYGAVITALARRGPLAVNVDASKWALYAGGVFDGCTNASSLDIDHAVTLVGYGRDDASGLDYWLIRNSWGPRWGEGGYIRLRRSTAPVPCATDSTPADGSACEALPRPEQRLTVCGDCGILFDTSLPLVSHTRGDIDVE